MKCECTIPKAPNGPEECHNEAVWDVQLTPEFENEQCYWCDVCAGLGSDMIASKNPLIMTTDDPDHCNKPLTKENDDGTV